MVDIEASSAEPFGAFAPPGLIGAAVRLTRRLPPGWAGRRAALALRRAVLWQLQGRPVDIEVLGTRMRLYPYRNVCEGRLLFTPQFFDTEELDFLAEHAREGFVFVDIGANVGGYALFVAARAGPTARIVAVEPQPAIFDRLVFNIRQNPFPIKALECAIADKGGEITLFIDTENQGETSVKILGAGHAGSIRVPAKTLHQLFLEEGFSRVDAVKLDVEGAEDLIVEPFLRSAPKALWPRFFLIENGAEHWQIDLPELMARSGYALIRRTRLNLIFERE